MKIGIVGAGSWGTAAAVMLGGRGIDVTLWAFLPEEVEALSRDRENKALLPGCKFPDTISVTGDLGECTKNAELVLLVVPSPAVRTTARNLADKITDGQTVVILTKGLEQSSLKRLSEVVEEEIPRAKVGVMSGPSHAEEVSRGLPTTNVAASRDPEVAKHIQNVMMSDNFRVYTCDDIAGVELGGALKNVIALCAGISDGLGYGDNTKAALMTRGMAEISRLGTAMGAKRDTFLGLSGVGDLIVTCTSMHSRNRRAGIMIGEGKSLDETLKSVGMVVEGVNTVTAAYKLAQKYNVEMPIVEQAYKVLFGGASPREAVYALMQRDKREE